MVLIQLLLPTGGAADGDGLALLAETRRELADRVNGLTAYLRSPAKGWWTAPDGHTEQDDVVMVEVPGLPRKPRVGLQCDGAIRDS